MASTGRARRSKWSGDVPTQKSRAFVCSKHVLSDEACWPISERRLSNRLILLQQPLALRKKWTNTEVIHSLYMLTVLKVVYRVCTDRCVHVCASIKDCTGFLHSNTLCVNTCVDFRISDVARPFL